VVHARLADLKCGLACLDQQLFHAVDQGRQHSSLARRHHHQFVFCSCPIVVGLFAMVRTSVVGGVWVHGRLAVLLLCGRKPKRIFGVLYQSPRIGQLDFIVVHHAPNPSLWVGTRLLIQTYLTSWLLIAMLSSNYPMAEQWAIGLRFVPLSVALVVVWRRTRPARQQLTSEERWGWQILWWALYSIGVSTNAYWTRYTIVWSGYSLAWVGEVNVWAAWLDPLLYIGNVFHWMGHLLLLLALVLATRQAFKKWYTTQ